MKVSFKDVVLGYQKKEIICGANLELKKGEILGIVGPNGVGKSTLLKTIAGIIKEISGSVELEGTVAYIPQEPRLALLPWYSVRKNIYLNRCELSSEEIETLARGYGLEASSEIPVYDLSGGLEQRLVWACALRENANILVMDEPFSRQDTNYKKHLHKVLRRYVKKGRMGILVDHDPMMLTRSADRIQDICFKERVPAHLGKVMDLKLSEEDRLDKTSKQVQEMSELITDLYFGF